MHPSVSIIVSISRDTDGMTSLSRLELRKIKAPECITLIAAPDGKKQVLKNNESMLHLSGLNNVCFERYERVTVYACINAENGQFNRLSDRVEYCRVILKIWR